MIKNMQYVIVKNRDLSKIKKKKGLLSNLSVSTPLSKVPVLGNILF